MDVFEGSIFFDITWKALNLFSFILGGMWGLSTPVFNRYRSWWFVVAYFMLVALYFAAVGGAFRSSP